MQKKSNQLKNKLLINKQDRNNKYNNNIVKELVYLTKENQLLKIQVESLKEQISKIYLNKNKYKKKYRELKASIQTNQLKKGNQNYSLRKHEDLNMHTNRKREDFSPVTHKNSWLFEGPSTGVQLNRAASSTNINNYKNCSLQLVDDVNQRNEKISIMETLEKINIGVQEILRQLQNSGQSRGNNCPKQQQKQQQKSPTIERSLTQLNNNINQIKEYIYEKTANTSSSNKSPQYYTHDKSQQQPSKYLKNKQRNQIMVRSSVNQQSYKQIKYDNHSNNQKKEMSGKGKRNLGIQNNILSYQIGVEDNGRERGSNKEKRGSHERRGSKNSKSERESVRSIESEREKWQQFHEIGKQLKNWRFENYQDVSQYQVQVEQMQTQIKEC